VKKVTLALFALALVGTSPAFAQDAKMSFFITSVGSGDGANLGGLDGADEHCQQLAYAAGSGDLTWRAYLSTIARAGMAGVNARDRIGDGPWFNYGGTMIARDVTHLHSNGANLTKATELNEMGGVTNGRGDQPNMHDLLTGSTMEGYSPTDGTDNCNNWTSNGEGSANVGHHDRQGGGANPVSWNSAHASRGCSQEDLVGTGGNGYFYCFATDGPTSQETPRPEDD
jgi:hypothetical protein